MVLGNKTGFRSGALRVLCVLKDSYLGGIRVELGWFVTHTWTFLTMKLENRKAHIWLLNE